MDNETLAVAARLGCVETVKLIDGYDKTKHPKEIMFRRFTMDDIRAISHGEYWFEANDGKARRVRVASQLKTWKRDPERFECTFKYGMYESARMDTKAMLAKLLVEV